MDSNLGAESRRWQEKLYSRSFRRQRIMDRVSQLTGPTHNLQCLEISAGDGMISTRLRELGGSWRTAVVSEQAANSLATLLSDKHATIEGETLPYEDGQFDRVVIVDALKYIEDDSAFIRECHRVLKSDGWVVISELRKRSISLAALLRHFTGTEAIAHGSKRNGYTDSELYGILRDGFDVPETFHYSNGLLECVAAIGEAVQQKLFNGPYWMVQKKPAQETLYAYRKLHRVASVTAPLCRLFALFDFMPGHRLVVKSRRRPWRPRLQPKLIDGRSIAEAAINTKIGTAAPF